MTQRTTISTPNPDLFAFFLCGLFGGMPMPPAPAREPAEHLVGENEAEVRNGSNGLKRAA